MDDRFDGDIGVAGKSHVAGCKGPFFAFDVLDRSEPPSPNRKARHNMTVAATYPIESVDVSVYTVPTESPESDGTAYWTNTTMVLVEVSAGGKVGLGYTYSSAASAVVITDVLKPEILGCEADRIKELWWKMFRSIRNFGPGGIAVTALSAVDAALWDLRARLLNEPLATTLGIIQPRLSAYGSGGFTSLDDRDLAHHCEHWVEQGFNDVKIKVGREPNRDPERVAIARQAIGSHRGLLIDANGAYNQKQALQLAERFVAESQVIWFEEPVPSADRAGLNWLRGRCPAAMDVAAGEYGYSLEYFQTMLEAGAIDVLQADMTRCGGVTGFLEVATLCRAFGISLSSHCAPALHLSVCAAAPGMKHMEFFYDHVRIEQLFFEGAPRAKNGVVEPNLSLPGNGLTFKRQDAARFSA